MLSASALTPALLGAANADSFGIIDLFLQMNLVEQIICYVLAGFSLVAWTVMIGKMAELGRLQQLNRAFEQRMNEQASLLNIPPGFRIPESIPFGIIFKEAMEAYHKGAMIDREFVPAHGKLKGVQLMENALQRGVARETLRYESSMVFLATIVSGAPFMGLLGTVWGVMHAFSAVGLQETVTLRTLAPGVAGALITTIAGLLVAIPAAFGYNYLLSRSRLMIAELESYASTLADRVEIENQG